MSLSQRFAPGLRLELIVPVTPLRRVTASPFAIDDCTHISSAPPRQHPRRRADLKLSTEIRNHSHPATDSSPDSGFQFFPELQPRSITFAPAAKSHPLAKGRPKSFEVMINFRQNLNLVLVQFLGCGLPSCPKNSADRTILRPRSNGTPKLRQRHSSPPPTPAQTPFYCRTNCSFRRDHVLFASEPHESPARDVVF